MRSIGGLPEIGTLICRVPPAFRAFFCSFCSPARPCQAETWPALQSRIRDQNASNKTRTRSTCLPGNWHTDLKGSSNVLCSFSHFFAQACPCRPETRSALHQSLGLHQVTQYNS
eukprot:1155518-Pelagomonas_calceolata.AAC.8